MVVRAAFPFRGEAERGLQHAAQGSLPLQFMDVGSRLMNPTTQLLLAAAWWSSPRALMSLLHRAVRGWAHVDDTPLCPAQSQCSAGMLPAAGVVGTAQPAPAAAGKREGGNSWAAWLRLQVVASTSCGWAALQGLGLRS